MLKRNQFFITVIVATLFLSTALLLYKSHLAKTRIEHLTLSDGSPITLAIPKSKATAQVLLAATAHTQLSENDLLALARHRKARVVQFMLPEGGCERTSQRAQEASTHLEGAATLVAGIDQGAAFAWRWLTEQNSNKAQALSVGFSLQQPDCDEPLPQQATHGRWYVAWNDNPDDPTARFVRNHNKAQTSISDYDTALADLLNQRLNELLQGLDESIPTIEVSQQQSADTVTLLYSGDGGWRDLDRDVADEMAAKRFPVVGIDCLRYFWQRKSPERAAADLSELMQQYREKWGAKHFVLAGYSFGADVLPALYNRLSTEDQEQVDAILLLALARSGSFQIEVKGWLGQEGQEAKTGPELARLPAEKVLCIYGQEEIASSGCTQGINNIETLQLPGGHHFDEDYPALAQRLVQAISQRQSQRPED